MPACDLQLPARSPPVAVGVIPCRLSQHRERELAGARCAAGELHGATAITDTNEASLCSLSGK